MTSVNQRKFRESMKELFNDKDMFSGKRRISRLPPGEFKPFKEMVKDACVRIDKRVNTQS